jgi:MFS family permease
MALSRRARFAVGYASAGHFLCHGAMILLPLLKGDVAAELTAGDVVKVSTASALYLVMMGVAAVPAGLLADRIGTARMLLIYFGAMAGAALLCALSTGFGTFVFAHALLGAAAGLYHPPGLGLISLSTGRDEMGPALGMHGVIGNIGVASSPLLVMTVLPEFGWRGAFFALALTAALAGLAGAWLIRRGHVMPGIPAESQPAADGRLARRGLVLLLVVMSVNGFLANGFTWQFPETVRQHGALIWDVMVVNTAILGLGAIGQYVGGLMARGKGQRGRYLMLLMLQPVTFLGTALLLDMPTIALLQLAAFAFVNYMSQPIENRILAGFTSTARRSAAFALKFMVALIIAAPAPWIVARIVRTSGEAAGYGFLCAVGTVGLLAGVFFVRSLRPPAAAIAKD